MNHTTPSTATVSADDIPPCVGDAYPGNGDGAQDARAAARRISAGIELRKLPDVGWRWVIVALPSYPPGPSAPFTTSAELIKAATEWKQGQGNAPRAWRGFDDIEGEAPKLRRLRHACKILACRVDRGADATLITSARATVGDYAPMFDGPSAGAPPPVAGTGVIRAPRVVAMAILGVWAGAALAVQNAPRAAVAAPLARIEPVPLPIPPPVVYRAPTYMADGWATCISGCGWNLPRERSTGRRGR